MKFSHFLFLTLFHFSCSQLLENGKGPLDFLPTLNVLPDSQPPLVLSTNPLNEQTGVSPTSDITVEFSKGMNKTLTEGSFSLRNGNNNVDGSFTWLNNILIFKPKTPLTLSGQYRIAIASARAESSSGTNLIRDYNSTFYVNDDARQPELISSSPLNGESGVSPGSSVQLIFSKPMKLSTVLTNISSAPQIIFDFPAATANSEGNIITLRTISPLVFGTTYTITIPASIQDSSGNQLLKGYQISFTVGNDFTRPVFEEISTSSVTNFVGTEYIQIPGVEKTDSFFLEFDEPILPSSIRSGLSFTPSVNYTITDVSANSTRFQITPISTLEIDTNYQINVSDQIKDIQNNGLVKSYIFNVKVNGPRSRNLWVRGVYLDLALTQELNTQNISTISSDGGVGPNYNFANANNGLYIYFCRGETLATCDTTSNPRDLSVRLTSLDFDVRYDFGPNIGSPYLSVPTNVTPIATDRFLMLTKLFSFAPNPSTYVFTIKGGKSGVLDQYDNFMKNDFTFRFRLNP